MGKIYLYAKETNGTKKLLTNTYYYNSLLFFCATILILVTILDTQVKVCPLAVCQVYV